MNTGQTIVWSEDHDGAVFSVTVDLPAGHPLAESHSSYELVDLVAAAGQQFRQFVELPTNVVDAEVEGYWECGAIARLGTPESPPELCETEVHTFGGHCRLHGGETPW